MSPLFDPYGKKIDESWKERVEKERKVPPPAEPAPRQGPAPAAGGPLKQSAPAGDFALFLSSLSMQAMVALGEMPHPVTQDRQEDLEQARYLIDVLGMLHEKTQGNLTPEEASLLEGVLYELRMKYVARTQGGTQ